MATQWGVVRADQRGNIAVAMNLLDDLDARGLIHDSTDRAALAARLADRKSTRLNSSH